MAASGLALILAVTMEVPASGPEKVSAQTEHRLELRGEWEGVWQNCHGRTFQAAAWMEGSRLRIELFDRGQRGYWDHLDIIDEGTGKARGRMSWNRRPFLGSYQQSGDRLVFSYGEAAEGRPPTAGGRGHYSLILRRVKPRK